MSRALEPWESPDRRLRNGVGILLLSFLGILGGIFSGCSEVDAQWGPRGCAPRVGPVGPSFRSQVITTQPAVASLTFRDGYPCSTLCTCGCNDGGPCPCKQLPAKATKAKPAAKQCGCTRDCPCGESLCRCNAGELCCHECPCRRAEAEHGGGGAFGEPVTQNFGIDLAGMGGPEVFKINGVQVPREAVYEAIQSGGQLTDDSRKLRVTVIGPEADCKRALEAMPAELKGRYLVQSFRPDNFLVARAGFKTDGTPTVYLQDPPDPKTGMGYVHWREDAFTADTWEHVRRADPDHKPANDPGPHQPKPAPPASVPASGPAVQPVPQSLPQWVWLAAAGVLAMLFLRQQPAPAPAPNK